MNNEYEIIEYSNVYRKKVQDFLISVAVTEFGFTEWIDYFNEANFLNFNKTRENFWIVLDTNNTVIATIGLLEDREPHIAKLHSLYVNKSYRKKGIATILYKTCEAFAKSKNYTTIILHTYLEFENAIKFYKKLGYKPSSDISSDDGIWYYKNISTEHKHNVWNDYFSNLRNKYSMRVSTKNPLIINLDGKGTTNNPLFSLVDIETPGGFLDVMESTVKYFTSKYHCLAIFGTDEVSFIFENPMVLINSINSDINKKSDEIISIFSQYFFDYFNSLNSKGKIFWHGECFSIPQGKVHSYIKYKMGSIRNVLTTYFLKKSGVRNAGVIKLDKKIEMCRKYDFYTEVLEGILDGILYYDGDRINIYKFLDGIIEVVDVHKSKKTEDFLDLTSFDWD